MNATKARNALGFFFKRVCGVDAAMFQVKLGRTGTRVPGVLSKPEARQVTRAIRSRGLARKGMKVIRIAEVLARRSSAVLAKPSFPVSCEELLKPFHGDRALLPEDYAGLFLYFTKGWHAYRTPSGEGASYPGLPSWSGAQVDRLEGFSRIMPLFGAWCFSGRSAVVHLPGGERLSLPDEFRRGLVAGTDPQSPVYWGEMPGESNQRIVEAADIALALWLFRDAVWASMASGERENVIRWLSLVEAHPGLDNNWHLFYVLIDRVLTTLGSPDKIRSARGRFDRIKSFHLGDGWFKDGPDGKVDFYSAWGFHYAMAWIDRIDPAWDPEFIHCCQRLFLPGYKHLIGPQGFPVLGRSVCYRMAAPAPLVFGHQNHPDLVSPGEARRALDALWRYFIRHGAARRGVATQGYFGADPRVLDPYSGPASSLWSLRALIAALALPQDAPFWQSEAELLPVERGDFEIFLTGPGWRVRGEQASGAITTEVMGNREDAEPPLAQVSWLDNLRSLASGRPRRPRNMDPKYLRRFYRSDSPFCGL